MTYCSDAVILVLAEFLEARKYRVRNLGVEILLTNYRRFAKSGRGYRAFGVRLHQIRAGLHIPINFSEWL